MNVKTQAGTRSLKVAQGEATKQALLAAGRQLFASQGYADTSPQAIVEAAGVTKGALYHHFSGKEELFQHVFVELKRELGAQLAEVLPHPDPWTGLVTACRTYIHVHTDPAAQRIVLLDARAILPHEVWHDVDSQWGAVMFRAALRRAMNRGTLIRLPPGPLALMITGALNEACLLVAHAQDRDSAEAEAMQVIEQLLRGLQARETPTKT